MASTPSEQEEPKQSYQPSEQVNLEVKILAAEVAALQAQRLKEEQQTEEEKAAAENNHLPEEPS